VKRDGDRESSMPNLSRKAARLFPLVKDILLREGDPLGVSRNEACQDEYDNYATSIVKLLTEGGDEHKLTASLFSFRTGAMGLTAVDEERDRKAASRLVELVGATERNSDRSSK
jgi:hypothetical protein